MLIKPIDVYNRLCVEHPNSTIIFDCGMNTIHFGKRCGQKIRARAVELMKKSQLINVHHDVGYISNKRNWWKR